MRTTSIGARDSSLNKIETSKVALNFVNNSYTGEAKKVKTNQNMEQTINKAYQRYEEQLLKQEKEQLIQAQKFQDELD